MRKFHTEERTETVEVTDDIICNYCGQSCRNVYMNYEGLIEAHVEGGYGAKLGDSTWYRFSLCESCLSSLFERFEVPVETGSNW